MNPKLNALFLALASVAVLAADFFKAAAGETPAAPPTPEDKPKKTKEKTTPAPATAPAPTTVPCDLDDDDDDDGLTLGGEAEPINYVELRAKIRANVVKNKDNKEWRRDVYAVATAAAGIPKGMDFAAIPDEALPALAKGLGI